MRVLSLFDGISCGKVVLGDVRYMASEIDTHAIQVSTTNHPTIQRLGDVRGITRYQGAADLLIGGSPCQSFSNAVTDNTGFMGKSGLFWEYARVLREVKPEFYLLENVPMKQEWEDVLSDFFGHAPVRLNSALFSPQSRERLYWTNVPLGPLPTADTQVLGDILETGVGEKYYYKEGYTLTGTGGVVEALLHINGNDIIKRVGSKRHKCQTLTAVCGGNQHKKVIDGDRVRKLTPVEYERLQGLPDGYTAGVSDSQRYKMLGNAWNVPTIKYLLSYLTHSL